MTTIVHDEFVDEPMRHNYEPHILLYGAKGWTDEVDASTINLLMRVGAIRLANVYSGIGWETRVYVSVQGIGPVKD